MKFRTSNNPARALTLIEVLAVIWVVAFLALILFALLAHTPRKRPNCASNLKQVALSFRLYAYDNNSDKYPASVSVTNGGTMELVARGDVFPHFQVMSNELQTPKVLICPQDSKRTWATNFASDFNDTHVSYFVGVDADQTRPEMLLAGDRNIIVNGVQLKHGLATLATNSPVGWSKKMHKNCGNVALVDGSVRQVDARGLREVLEKSGVTNRLAIP